MRPRGFTLVELLVVISIIALLLGLCMPVLWSARREAQKTVCLGHVRQLQMGLCRYEADNGTFPCGMKLVGMPAPPGPYAGNPGIIDLAGWWWFDYSEKVNHATMDGLEVLTCPSKRQTDRRLAADILCGNYGVNLSICRVQEYIKPYRTEFSGTPWSLARVARPGDTLLLVDSGYSLISWWHVTNEPPVALPSNLAAGGIQHATYIPGMTINRDKALWTGQTEDAISGRHPGKTVNVGFADGHAASKRAEELFVEKTGADQWKNYPLWKPDREVVTPPATAP